MPLASERKEVRRLWLGFSWTPNLNDNVATNAEKAVLKTRTTVRTITDADQCLTGTEKVIEHGELQNDGI